jgi:hypothetical protein
VRVDVRIEKRWHAFGGTIGVVFEWLNALLSKETIGTSCSAADGSGVFPGSAPSLPQCRPTEVGPITFPSIGVEGEW